jgi:hypothetical protein
MDVYGNHYLVYSFFLLETTKLCSCFLAIVYLTVERDDRLPGLVGYPLNKASRFQMHEGARACISYKEKACYCEMNKQARFEIHKMYILNL